MNIPQEILDHISGYLPDRSYQANAALVNKSWNSSMTPILYRHIDISESTESRVRFRETGELPQMYSIALTLAKNPYLSSLVHSIRHEFYIDSQTDVRQRQKWEVALLRIRSLFQEVINRNGFPRVNKLIFHHPEFDIADILLKGLLRQVQSLQIVTPYFRHLSFDTGQNSGFCNLGELEVEFSQDYFRRTGSNLLNDQLALQTEYSLIDEQMHSRLNRFLSHCPFLQVLKITGTKELHTLLQSVNFTSLKVLEIGPIFNHQIDFAIICLNLFLERHPSISRLALNNLPNETSHSLKLSAESSLNIREFISCIEEIPSDYFMFLRQFQKLETYRLEHHMIVGGILHDELLNLLPELQHHMPGIRNLTLPMPTHIAGWTLTDQKKEMARNALMEFGKALTEFVPTVEKFGISQIGRFADLEAADWARSLSPHASLRHIAIKTSFLPNISIHDSEYIRQGLINQLAQEFAVVARLKSFVFFESMDQQAIRVEIVRMDDGTVEGEEMLVERGEVDRVFFDEFFDSGW